MNSFVINNEASVRLGFFLGIFAVMALWEFAVPRRHLTTAKGSRWFANLSIAFLNTALLRILLPMSGAGIALTVAARGWGLLNMVHLPVWAEGVIVIVLLDLTIYSQHVVFHHVPLLWRLHKMHHTDLDLDVSSGARFHPAEMLISMGIKLVAITLIGAPAWAVVVFEVILNGTSMFNHSNVLIPPTLDRVLRMMIVTPDMHRVHHSVIIRETNSNLGFNFPWWDRLFGTYQAQPAAGHLGMKIGLANYRRPEDLTLLRLLAIPLNRKER